MCVITVEIAGPKVPPFISETPDKIFLEALHTVDTCRFQGYVSMGGFVTWPTDKLNSYVTDLRVNLEDAYRKPVFVLLSGGRAGLLADVYRKLWRPAS